MPEHSDTPSGLTMNNAIFKHSVQLEGLEYRIKHIEDTLSGFVEMRASLARMEERLKGQEERIDERITGLENKMEQWKSMVWMLIFLILTQLVVAGVELLKR